MIKTRGPAAEGGFTFCYCKKQGIAYTSKLTINIKNI